jgi:outer membrane murein-binding lipoprotein Lpp
MSGNISKFPPPLPEVQQNNFDDLDGKVEFSKAEIKGALEQVPKSFKEKFTSKISKGKKSVEALSSKLMRSLPTGGQVQKRDERGEASTRKLKTSEEMKNLNQGLCLRLMLGEAIKKTGLEMPSLIEAIDNNLKNEGFSRTLQKLSADIEQIQKEVEAIPQQQRAAQEAKGKARGKGRQVEKKDLSTARDLDAIARGAVIKVGNSKEALKILKDVFTQLESKEKAVEGAIKMIERVIERIDNVLGLGHENVDIGSTSSVLPGIKGDGPPTNKMIPNKNSIDITEEEEGGPKDIPKILGIRVQGNGGGKKSLFPRQKKANQDLATDPPRV